MSKRIVQIAFVAIGLLAVFIGFGARPSIPDGWATADGVVVELIRDSEGLLTPVIEYSDQSGEVYTITAPWAASPELAERVGYRIAVAYDPVRPASARIVGGPLSWIWLMMLAAGGLFAGIGGIWLLRDLRGTAGPPAQLDPGAHALQPSKHLHGGAYRFDRPTERRLLDLVIAPAMTLMFGFVAFITFASGGPAIIFGIAASAAALLLGVSTVHSLSQGFGPAAEVGADGLWLRGVGRLAWSDIEQIRVETFAGPTSPHGLAMYRRLAVIPRDASASGRRSALVNIGHRLANGYYRTVMPLAGRRPIDLQPFGLMAYEVADFDGLIQRIGRFHPVVGVSDEPAPAG